jgi:hypothetical protein
MQDQVARYFEERVGSVAYPCVGLVGELGKTDVGAVQKRKDQQQCEKKQKPDRGLGYGALERWFLSPAVLFMSCLC